MSSYPIPQSGRRLLTDQIKRPINGVFQVRKKFRWVRRHSLENVKFYLFAYERRRLNRLKDAVEIVVFELLAMEYGRL